MAGEMADADYGYVGNNWLYLAISCREEIKKVPESQGVEELINLIRQTDAGLTLSEEKLGVKSEESGIVNS
jgi:4-hydroxy-3-methylbut-2-en-1-yl diphosphate synthase IspG/GcpE